MGRMMAWIGLGSCLLLGVGPWAQAADNLAPAVDLPAEARLARQGGYPLVVLFSRPDCTYCETVRRDYLQPMMVSPRYRERVVIRQINLDSERPLVDFSGRMTTQAEFARREKIKLVPVVAFYGANGKAVAEPIVGVRIPDFYAGYLDDAMQKGAR